MTHLRIELNNIQENVSSAVIKKLYELATSGDLDLSSNLAGNLHTTATYLEYIDGITGEFPELTISSDNIYIMFADPEVKRVMATLFGDGTNVSVSNLTGVTTLPSLLFLNNSNISTFNELKNLRGITTIGSDCFSGSTILSITLDNITTVYSFAFHNCSLSGEISMPNLTTIKRNAFSSNSVTKINFGGSITSTPLAVCDNSRSLTLVSGLNNLTQIGENTFRNTALTSCDIDFTKVTSVGPSAFENVQTLTIDGDFLEMLTISSNAFYNATLLTGALVCPKLTSLGQMAFRYCTGLTSVDFTGSTFTTINNYTFDGCTNLTSVTLPSTCTTIGGEAFRECTNLTSIDTSNVTSMGGLCFKSCTNLTSLDFSNVTHFYKAVNGTHVTRGVFPKMTTIVDSAFEYSPFVYLEFGENLTSIGIQVFWSSPNLRTLVFRSTTPPSFNTTNSNRFLYDMSNLTIYVPDASVNDYKTAWSAMTNQITGISNLPQS